MLSLVQLSLCFVEILVSEQKTNGFCLDHRANTEGGAGEGEGETQRERPLRTQKLYYSKYIFILFLNIFSYFSLISSV